jgi:glyoxylase-like metal-dependent hydrolase (beta-lactamase superfamily II)
MTAPRILELGRDRLLIDLDFRDTEGLVGTYLLPEEVGWSLIETGPSSCRERLREGLARAGVAPSDVRHVFVTHIHLDHAGALGTAAEMFPRAQLLVHREGVPHMIDPTKLVASARRAWGEASDRLWGPILPVPSQRLVGLSGGERFPLRDGELAAIPTPGHAKHHLAFFDSATQAIFSGDAAGVRLEDSWRARPALPPPDLDLEQLIASADRMAELQPRRLFYSHFGARDGAARELMEYTALVDRWRSRALAAAKADPSVDHVARALVDFEHEDAAARGVPLPPEDRSELISGTRMAAQGLLRYFRLRGDLPG